MKNKFLDFERQYLLLTKTFYNFKRYSLLKKRHSHDKKLERSAGRQSVVVAIYISENVVCLEYQYFFQM